MGGGEAAIAAMIQAIRNNRVVLKSKRKIFDKHPSKTDMRHRELEFKQATPTELKAFREKLQAEKRKQIRLTVLAYLIGILLLAATIILIST